MVGDGLEQALVEILAETSWARVRERVEALPELAGPDILTLLDAMLENPAGGLARPEALARVRDVRAVLGRCQEAGVERAFGEVADDGEGPAGLRAVLDRARASGDRAFRGDAEAAAAWSAVVEHEEFVLASASVQLDALGNAGMALAAAGAAAGREDQVRRALAILDGAVEQASPGQQRLVYLNNLGSVLAMLASSSGRPDDIRRLVSVTGKVLDATPADSPLLAGRLSNRGNALLLRSASGGRPRAPLDQAIDLFSRSVDLHTSVTSDDDRARGDEDGALYANNLGSGLMARFERYGRREDLDRAVGALDRAVAWSPPDSPGRPLRMLNLAYACAARAGTGDLDRAGDLLVSALPPAAGATKAPPDVAQALSQLVATLDGCDADADVVRPFARMGGALHQLGYVHAARRVLERALAAARGAGGLENDAAIASVLVNLAISRWTLGDAALAAAMLREALMIMEAGGEPDDPALCGPLTSMGTALQSAGDLAGAVRCHERSLAVAIATRGPFSAETVTALTNLGTVRRDQRDLPAAVRCHRRALGIGEATGQAGPLDIVLSNLGLALRELGRLEQSRRMFDRALTLTRFEHGEAPLDVAITLLNLGATLLDLGENDRARQRLTEARTIFHQTVGPGHQHSRSASIYLTRAQCQPQRAAQSSPAAPAGPETTPEEPEELDGLVYRFAMFGPHEARRLLDDHPRLLDPRADDLLRQAAEARALVGGELARRRFARARELLSHARAGRADTAFAHAQADEELRIVLPAGAVALFEEVTAAVARHDTSGELTDLDSALARWRELAALPAVRAADDLTRTVVIEQGAAAFQTRYERSGGLDDLDAAAALFAEALRCAAAAGVTEVRLSCLNNLGNIMVTTFEARSELVALAYAIELYGQAVRGTPTGSPDRPTRVGNLGGALLARWRSGGEIADLEEATCLLDEAVRATRSGETGRSRHLSNLGSALLEQIDRATDATTLDDLTTAGIATMAPPDGPSEDHGGPPEDEMKLGEDDAATLDRAVDSLAAALAEGGASWTDRVRQLGKYGRALHLRYAFRGAPRDLDWALDVTGEAVAAAGEDSPLQPGLRVQLAVLLSSRFLTGQDSADLDEAIRVLSEGRRHATGAGYAALGRMLDHVRALRTELVAAEDEPAPGLPAELAAAVTQARARHGAFRQSGDPDDLLAAIEAQQAVVARTTRKDVPPAARADAAHALAAWRMEHFESTGDQASLAAGVAGLELLAGSASAPAGTRTPASSRSVRRDLGSALLARFGHVGSLDDLQRAVGLLEELYEAASGEERPLAAADLAGCLWQRYQYLGSAGDLDRAVDLLDAADLRRRRRTPGLLTWATVLDERYQRAGRPEDLARALALVDQTLVGAPAGSALWAAAQNNRGLFLRERFEAAGSLADLDRAVAAHDRSVAHTATGSPAYGRRLNNLGLALLARARATDTLADADRAHAALLHALDHTPADAADRPRQLLTMAAALMTLPPSAARSDRLDHALAVVREARATIDPRAPLAPLCTFTLGRLLQLRFDDTDDPEALDQSIDLLVEALPALARRPLAEATCRRVLADGLRLRHDRTGAAEDLSEAVAAYSALCVDGWQAHPSVALDAATNWGNWASARSAWGESADAFGHGMTVLRFLFRVQLGRRHRETSLYQARDLPAHAAYALARAGRLEQAVVAAEQGRAMLLSEALERDRAALDALDRAGRADLVSRYRDACAVLAAHSRQDADIGGTTGLAADTDRWVGEVAAAEARFETVTAQIRAVPGHERFLDPPGFDEVVTAATEATLAYLVSAEPGGLALIVGADGSVRAELLPDADSARVRLIAETYQLNLRGERFTAAFAAIAIGGVSAAGDVSADGGDAADDGGEQAYGAISGDDADLVGAERDLAADQAERRRGLLAATCDMLGETVMAGVLSALAGQPRAVLIPLGPLGLLPLHAARVPDPAAPTGYRYALDQLELTYAPNARALALARAATDPATPDRALVVEEPAPVDAEPLPGAALEGDILAAAFPQTRRLRGEQATVRAVRDAIGDMSMLHFACHGRADDTEPLDSGLRLAGDQMLRLRDLVDLPLQARLVVMAACESAVSADRLPDEVVGLHTGFLQAGAAGVVGAQWPVWDAAALLCMLSFYDHWQRCGLTAAGALRAAERWLRDTTNGQKRDELAALLAEDEPWPSRQVLEAATDTLAFLAPASRDFAEPVHWAAFVYTGI